MEKVNENLRLESWVERQLSVGKFGFALGTIRQSFKEQSETAIKFALKRLADKGKIISIFKGYYLIIPPQYVPMGVLPPAIFLDSFMIFLERPYYLGLLNAAAYHGAAHQQPQEFFVVTDYPVLRPTFKKGLKVNYISKKEIPGKLLDTKKTESGFIKISNPLLTAIDLIHFEKRIGGLNRAATVLNELVGSIKPQEFNDNIIKITPVTTFQRIGYILDNVIGNKKLALALFRMLERVDAKLFRIPLKASAPVRGCTTDELWKVIINTEIEID